jgi:alkylation response protein AidB-like acyl-CoA dehydrogenase
LGVVTPEPNLGGTTATGTISFSRTPAVRVSGDADAALDRVADLAGIALACMQAAAMKQALDLTAGYAKARYSFGQAIGSYQGVKHKLAVSNSVLLGGPGFQRRRLARLLAV